METDTNGLIGALLRDLATIQPSKQSGLGYKRAAHMVLGLDHPIESLLRADGTLEKTPNVGPKSELVILEVLRTGASPTVERAVEKSGKAADIAVHRSLRDNYLSRAQVVSVLADTSLGGPSLAEYRGDVQMHSTSSDGTQTLDEIADAAIARGYEFCAVTDHSYGLRIANGVSMADLAKQHIDIDRVNREREGRFRLIKGIEANIAPDGSIDMSPAERAKLELVLVAPHSSLRAADDQTARMMTAVQTPGIHVLGHPRGRQYGTRAGVNADWDVVFGAVVRAGIAIEIDGDPSRQDLDYLIAQRALVAGCLFALDSDAHSTYELRYAEWALAHARLAGIPSERIINCWPLDRLLEWLASRSEG
ncbi:MAG TPA: DNA polymerase/3'-5' exonuclease PolX [Gemmatimonadaceae bacterium]|nr:DNA polymerase/3'-5' exonuclease PolX [Gemmatimonadaceae bacterium]